MHVCERMRERVRCVPNRNTRIHTYFTLHVRARIYTLIYLLIMHNYIHTGRETDIVLYVRNTE